MMNGFAATFVNFCASGPAGVRRAGLLLILISTLVVLCGRAQPPQTEWTELSLESLDAFVNVPSNWVLAGTLYVDSKTRRSLESGPGTGLLVNRTGVDSPADLFTSWEHGDIELELEFMMAKESNSGIYFQGRYELQLFDSWGVERPRFGDMGGIYEWREEGRGGGGIPPRVNAARAPGLWQHLSVRYRAPRFDETGRKIANARFEEVILNGEMIHREVEVDRPTGGSISAEETASAPMRIQGTHGPVAFRNIRYRELKTDSHEHGSDRSPELPIRADVGDEPLVLHGFMDMGSSLHTHTAAIAFPEGVHAAFDQNGGGLLRIWKGEFVDARSIWVQRGGRPLSINEAASIRISASPDLAYLEDAVAWPDSLQEGVRYRLDNYRIPGNGSVEWSYSFDRYRILDRFVPDDGNRSLRRQLTLETDRPDEALHFRIAGGSSISLLPNGLYQVEDHTYFLRLCEEVERRVRLRQTPDGMDLLLSAGDSESLTFSYTLIW